MKKQLEQIAGFHEKFGDIDALSPTIDIPAEIKQTRIVLMSEEFREVVEAIENNHDITKLAKELADLVYTTLGTVCAYGLADKFEAIFEEVHQSNMSKDFNEHGHKPIKGEDYKEADIKKILQKYE